MDPPPVSSSSPQASVPDAAMEAESEPAHHGVTSRYMAALWKDKPMPPLEVLDVSESDDECESDDGHESYQEEHGDHLDEVVYFSPWKNWPDSGRGWPHDTVRILDMSEASDKLLEDPDSRRWLRKLSQLEHKNLPSLKVRTEGRPKIPLFRDETTGDEYQLYLELGLRAGMAVIECPTNLVPEPENPMRLIPRADPLYQVRYRLPPADASCHGPISNPEFIIPLGQLAVRTSSREPWKTLCSTKGYPPPTEFTDYMVVVDAGHKDLPVWIIASQSILKYRMESRGRDYPQLPVFRGAMGNDEYGFDTACILRSIRDLPRRDFDQAYELVRNTRSVMDPRIMKIAAEKMAELSGTELRDDWDAFPPREIVTAEDMEGEVKH
ncbi:hypothetical protein KVR01_013346 [Diaporthe batatas]|uniref:uncharacterized protein n=1 Tax=Diaporthe batatas TaxID=748121 RepID=UPI001D035F8D|nr:uncharacterized protein KVR01_013346 [Diaporthe batatas]KAG8156741.1 hypothetical protein KVR01_013346 [Diaporthe batatas]